jgi:hypothetical protein
MNSILIGSNICLVCIFHLIISYHLVLNNRIKSHSYGIFIIIPLSLLQTQADGGVPVVYACNPSYSGGRDQGNHSPKPGQANSF